MPGLTTLTLSLPEELVAAMRDSVAAGEYASEAEAVADAFRLAFADETPPFQGPEFERFLREEVAAAYDQAVADPGSTIPAEEVMDHLRAMRQARRSRA